MLVCLLPANGARAQHVETKVENAVVVYVEGNDVVLKFTDGDVRLFEIADSSRYMIDGKNVSVHELLPGMAVTATITTANPPAWVDTVEVGEAGTVWKSLGGSLIVRTRGGENKMYRVPAGSRITLDGTVKTLDQLHEGDRITATVVRTKTPPAGANAAPMVRKSPPTPARVGALLIDEGTKPDEQPGTGGIPLIAIIAFALLLVTVLVLLVSRRKRMN